MGIVRWEQRFRGRVRHIFELHNFPFDVQELVLELRTEWHVRRLRPMPGSALTQEFALAEFALHRPKELECYENEAERACARIRIQASRRPKFYVINVMAITGAISTIGLGAFAFDLEDLGGRSSLVLTLLLAQVSFKFTVAESVPNVPYLHQIDIYMLTTFFFLVAIVLENFLVAWLVKERADMHLAATIDLWAVIVLTAMWVLFHAIFALAVVRYYAVVMPRLEPIQQLRMIRPPGDVLVLPSMLGQMFESSTGYVGGTRRTEERLTARMRWSKASRWVATKVRGNSVVKDQVFRRSAWRRSKNGASLASHRDLPDGGGPPPPDTRLPRSRSPA